MKSKSVIRFLTLLLIFSCVNFSQATVFYEEDYEEGIQYYGNTKHPGGGAISFLGGEIVGDITPGDGTQDFTQFNNVIRDGSNDAAASISGSQFSLKTQYRAGGSEWGYRGDFQLNTTIIGFPPTDTVYVRWYQKWGTNWVWPEDQQKLIKIKGEEQSQNFKISWTNNFINLTKRSPDGLSNETYVFSALNPGEIPNDYLQADTDPQTINYKLEKNRWYCIEVMVKSNTPGQNNAEFAYWIDGGLKLRYTNTNNRGSSTKGISSIELQHVLQDKYNNPSLVDTPTWMDNVVIADTKIGCVSGAVAPKPPMNPTINP
jgi:hypothetical protein